MIEIVNVNKKWGIGKNGDLLVFIPEDMKFFRTMTKEKTVIMGRKTLESFPEGKPLKGRKNIVITSNPENMRKAYCKEGFADGTNLYLAAVTDDNNDNLMFLGVSDENGTALYFVGSTEEALSLAEAIDGNLDDVYVIGGASVYKSMLPFCDTCLVTVNDCNREADSYFTDLDNEKGWKLESESEEKESEGIHFTFRKYVKKNHET